MSTVGNNTALTPDEPLMKLTVIFLLVGCQLATAQTNFFPFLRCKDRSYTNATISTITPATVNVSWDDGGVTVPIASLPDELQRRYHYNQQKAQRYLERQAAEKAAHQKSENQEASALATAQNTLGPAQNIRIIKPLPFPNSLQIEVEGILCEGCIPNLPPEILTFIQKLDQAQSDATNLKQRAERVRSNANRANGLAENTYVYDSTYGPRNNQANNAQDDAREAEVRSADADALLKKLQSQAKDRTTIIARPTGKMITARIRQWQFEAMASADLSGR
jgi:hypothetical protein